MSSNVGLSTPRGSGTSGYVQRNLSFLKPRDTGYGAPYPPLSASGANADKQSNNSFRQRKPDQQILEHDRRRAIEVKLLEERDRLEEENEEKGEKDKLSEEEIEGRLDEMRKRLVAELEDELKGGSGDAGGGDGRRGPLGSKNGDGGKGGRKQFKTYQVHELAEAKIEESERLRRALGIRGEGEQGDEWRWGGHSAGRREDRERERERERERGGRGTKLGIETGIETGMGTGMNIGVDLGEIGEKEKRPVISFLSYLYMDFVDRISAYYGVLMGRYGENILRFSALFWVTTLV
ncbi:hypothetical protein ACJ72_03624 [Emergomyces africanus]|uniref:CWF21 domain-containing protein n=1 Tax=Emergomyces africanus TaxID=1955775 RepID=A0A1B7NZH2_9EURO|nr:hypothetical protein ACJ72_03624 [Emergomyces africanus]